VGDGGRTFLKTESFEWKTVSSRKNWRVGGKYLEVAVKEENRHLRTSRGGVGEDEALGFCHLPQET